MKRKKAIIVQVISPLLKYYDLEEFKALVYAANYEIIDFIDQKPKKINSKFCLGNGKVIEICNKFSSHEEDLVYLFNNRLRSNQIFNLSEKFKAKVIDRDLLILEIFKLNTTTYEAKLQIEIAGLFLEKSQKKEEISIKKIPERQGRDFMGKGYGDFESYKRSFNIRKKNITKKLREIRNQRAFQRKSRKGAYNVAIVGYTNAGKTTLLNTINKSNFKTKESVFTTVGTVTRKIKYYGDTILFTDTVGFVYDLPHQFIDAFLSTLEEAAFSNCILILVDISDRKEKIYMKLQTVFGVLARIKALNIPVLYVFNKIDKINPDELTVKMKLIKRKMIPRNSIMLFISALDRSSSMKLIHILKKIKNKTLYAPTGEEIHKLIIKNPEKDVDSILKQF
ncbi:MAG: GTPase HflX [Promethearchaeota archaeon]